MTNSDFETEAQENKPRITLGKQDQNCPVGDPSAYPSWCCQSQGQWGGWEKRIKAENRGRLIAKTQSPGGGGLNTTGHLPSNWPGQRGIYYHLDYL